MTGQGEPSTFLMKKKEEVIGDCPSSIQPVARFSSRNSLQAFIFSGDKG